VIVCDALPLAASSAPRRSGDAARMHKAGRSGGSLARVERPVEQILTVERSELEQAA
jgi:hypothetical protein